MLKPVAQVYGVAADGLLLRLKVDIACNGKNLVTTQSPALPEFPMAATRLAA